MGRIMALRVRGANGGAPWIRGEGSTHTGHDQARWYPAPSAGVAQWQSNRLVSGRSWVRIPSPALGGRKKVRACGCEGSERVARIAADEGPPSDRACSRPRRPFGGRRDRPDAGRPLRDARAQHGGLGPWDGDPARHPRARRDPAPGGRLRAVRPPVLHGRVQPEGRPRRPRAARPGAPTSHGGHQGSRAGDRRAAAVAGTRRRRSRAGRGTRAGSRTGARCRRARPSSTGSGSCRPGRAGCGAPGSCRSSRRSRARTPPLRTPRCPSIRRSSMRPSRSSSTRGPTSGSRRDRLAARR